MGVLSNELRSSTDLEIDITLEMGSQFSPLSALFVLQLRRGKMS